MLEPRDITPLPVNAIASPDRHLVTAKGLKSNVKNKRAGTPCPGFREVSILGGRERPFRPPGEIVVASPLSAAVISLSASVPSDQTEWLCPRDEYFWNWGPGREGGREWYGDGEGGELRMQRKVQWYMVLG